MCLLGVYNQPKNELDSIPITLILIDHKAGAFVRIVSFLCFFLIDRSFDQTEILGREMRWRRIHNNIDVVAISLRILARDNPVSRMLLLLQIVIADLQIDERFLKFANEKFCLFVNVTNFKRKLAIYFACKYSRSCPRLQALDRVFKFTNLPSIVRVNQACDPLLAFRYPVPIRPTHDSHFRRRQMHYASSLIISFERSRIAQFSFNNLGEAAKCCTSDTLCTRSVRSPRSVARCVALQSSHLPDPARSCTVLRRHTSVWNLRQLLQIK